MTTVVTVSMAVGLVLALAGTVPAADPTQSDFDACTRAAQAMSSPSAAPSTGATGPPMTTPSGTPDTTAGVQQGGTANKTAPMITGTERTPGRTSGVAEGTGALTKEDTAVRGMSPEGMKDPIFKAAFHECMRQHGF